MATGVKRNLFSKPAWAAAATSAPPPDEGSIFGRNVVYEDILQAEKAKRERKAAKAKSRAEDVTSEGSESKRRRISESLEKDKDAVSSDLEVHETGSPPGEKRDKGKKSPHRRVTRSTPKKEKLLTDGLDGSPKTYQSPRRRPRAKSPSIALDEDPEEDDELVMLSPPRPNATSSSKQKKNKNVKDTLVDEDSDEEEDEYLRQLKQKAREKARLQRRDLTAERPSTPLRGTSTAAESVRSASVSTDVAQSRPVSSSSAAAAHQDHLSRPKTPALEIREDDAEVKILIQSEIPNTRPLIVKRKASQSLKQVKEFWCMKFELDEDLARTVFFTWKGTRLFDSTTMLGIIRRLKKDHYKRQQRLGRAHEEGAGDKDGFDFGDGDDDELLDYRSVKDPSGGNIMLEATTPELHVEQQRRKERQQQAVDGQDGDDADTAAANDDDDETRPSASSSTSAAAAAAASDQAAIVIRLVSRDLEPMQLRVRPHTTISKIMRGYAATRKVEDGKTPWLIFDGVRLDGDSTVEEVGLEDEDEVEVSIR